jgi:hypothetical protein
MIFAFKSVAKKRLGGTRTMKQSILPLACSFTMLFATQAAMAQLPVWAEWNGGTVYLKTNTPGSPKYTCQYTLNVVFTDGTRETVRGQTDPPTGGSPITASTRTFNKGVSNATANWTCRVI